MQIEGHPDVVHVLTSVCLGVTILFQLLSLIELKNTKNKWDFFDGFNIINNICYIVYYFYYYLRQNHMELKYMPNESDDYQGKFPYE